MSLFTKPVNSITYESVIDFCKLDIKEGINLDYKEDFPRNLEKTISAFANTNGGLIIIGIKDDDGKPKPPFIGINYIKGLEERVWNIILNNIYLPIFPEIIVCPKKNGKTFVVIRIAESNETPHTIFNNKRVYIRTGNVNKPEELATIDQLEWLNNRRTKSINFREELKEKANERSDNMSGGRRNQGDYVEYTLSYCPLYPNKSLIEVDNIDKEIFKIRNGTIQEFHFPQMLPKLTPTTYGMNFYYTDSYFYSYTEINEFGLIFNIESLFRKNYREVSLLDLFLLLRNSLILAQKFYDKIGFRGLFEINLSLENLYDSIILPLGNVSPDNVRDIEKFYTERNLSWNDTLNMSMIGDDNYFEDKLVNIYKKIAWSFGLRINADDLKHYIILLVKTEKD